MLDKRSLYRQLLDTAPWILLVTIILVAAVAGVFLVRVDQWLQIEPDADRIWLYGGSADAAMSVLSAIASSSITVAGVVFSATYVTMQLASSQYTPRVVQALARRWSLHLVLGSFLASFTYSLLILRSIRPEDQGAEFVPVVSVSVAIALAFASVGVFTFYVVYGMRSLQPTFIIDSAARETVELLHRSLAASTKDAIDQVAPIATPDAATGTSLSVSNSGFLQNVRFSDLLTIATNAGVTVLLTSQVGRHYFRGEPLAMVWPKDRCTPMVEAEIRSAIRFGSERTTDQDIEYGFRRVADIMLKALSASINDPTTAEYCLNTLGDMVILVANEPVPQRSLTDADHVTRVIWAPEPFDRCVHTAFDQLRFYVGNDLTLAVYALDVFCRVANLIPESARGVMLEIAGNFLATAQGTFTVEEDLEILAEAGAWLNP